MEGQPGLPDIRENYLRVRESVDRACEKAGRKPDEVILVAVSKTMPVELVRMAVESGATDLGENYVQEAEAKIPEVGRIARWHFIGHLQSNKARKAASLFDVVQAVDSLKLAEALGRAATEFGRTLEVLLEVNIGEEGSKAGVAEENALDLALQVSGVPGLNLSGLMCIPPFGPVDETRKYFGRMRDLFDRLPESSRQTLSMGMSSDYEAAIEEGSTMVRIGTAIFGPRRARAG